MNYYFPYIYSDILHVPLGITGRLFTSRFQGGPSIYIAMKDLNDWTKKEFEALNQFTYGQEIPEFTSLIILPTKYIHDSGYKCMAFIPIDRNNVPLGKISGGSDVIHLDGIGGMGYRWIDRGYKDIVKVKGWSMDCLIKSGLVRIMCGGYKLISSKPISSFEIFAVQDAE